MTDSEQQPQDKNMPLPFTMETTTETTPQWTISKLSDLFLKGLPAVAGLTAIFAVAGYVIVNLSLGFYTDIQPYSVVLHQYIAAGIAVFIMMAMIFVPAWIFSRRRKRLSRIGLSLIMALSESFPVIVVFSIYNSSLPSYGVIFQAVALCIVVFGFLIGSISELINMAANNDDLSTKIYAGTIGTFVIVLYVLAIVAAYPFLPRSIGGGYPSRVQLLFKDAEFAQSLDIPMVSDTETDEICLLAELTDGYLMYDPSHEQSFVIKYDLVTALRDTRESLDCSILSPNSTPAPSP